MASASGWDKAKIQELLDKNPLAVERAIVVIFNRQTDSEQSCDETTERNGVGFGGCDAHSGSYYAKWVLNGKHLTGKHLEKARKMAKKYHRQLLDEIKAKGVACGTC